MQFNWRVLEEGLNESHPLLERIKFVSIFNSNLDELLMIRVSGLRQQLESGIVEAPPDGMAPAEQLAAIRQRVGTDAAAHDVLLSRMIFSPG